jgi:hypothetical protein
VPFNRQSSLWTAVAITLSLARAAIAWEAPTVGGSGLESAIARASEQPPDPRLVIAAARTRLVAAIDELERFLTGSSPEASRGWNEWLKLPQIKVELARPEPDIQTLREIAKGHYAGQAGLELPPFLALRRSLRGLISAEEYGAAESPSDEYRSRLNELAECVARLEQQTDQADAHRGGVILGWIENLSDDGAGLARAIRARHCRQNVVAQVSGQLINVLLEQRVDERQFLTDIILGTYTAGPAHTSGHVSFAVVPNPRQGTLEVRLRGLTECPENVAKQRGVSIYSAASTTISANKRVHMNDQGLALDRATAWCSTSARIEGVEARSRLIERLAMRRASRLLPEAEAAAAQKAEVHASSKLDERADAALGGINDLFCKQIRAPLIRQDALPPLLRFWSDQAHLRLALSQHNDAQLAVASPVPQLKGGYDLALAAHESMIDNFCESMLGGATVKDTAWLGLMNLLTGSEPRALWVHDRTEPWSVTFADERPVLARFQGNRLELTLRLAIVRHGTEQFNQPVEIEARMIPQMTREGPALTREGNVSIRFPSQVHEAEVTPWRTLLAQKFEAVFPSQLHFDGLVPPAGGTLGRLRNLELVEFGCGDGWTTLGYQLPGSRQPP